MSTSFVWAEWGAMKTSLKSFLLILPVMITSSAMAASLDAARQYYSERDFRAAAYEYGSLLTLNWPKENLGELYDRYTECLVITGNYKLADSKIDYFLKVMPDDPLASKLAARKTEIAHELGKTTQPTASAASMFNDHGSTKNPTEIYDELTQNLMIAGKYDEANAKINVYLAEHPTDPLCEKLFARKVQMAYYANDFTATVQLGQQYLDKYNHFSESGLKTQKLLVDAMGRCGQYQDRIAFIQKELSQNPKHPLYAELRKVEADTWANNLNRARDARIRYIDVMKHSPTDSEIYESCAYRIGNIVQGQAKYAGKTNPHRATVLTSQSLHYFQCFLDHPGADKNYPANAKHRIVALKRVGRFDDMEREATRYLSNDNVVNYNEIVAVKAILGEYSDFQNFYGAEVSVEDKPAIREIKAAYYSDNYTSASRLAQDYINSHTRDSAARQLAQRLYIGSMTKMHGTKEVIACVSQALKDNPNHKMYADFRRAQADALWDMKKITESRAMFVDAMAHASNDSDVYDWCCFQAGSAAMYESNQPGIDAGKKKELRAIGSKYMAEYVALPSNDRIFPSNVLRRMTAWNYLDKKDEMEAEATRYLSDHADTNDAVHQQIQKMISSNRNAR